jgi:hypothetical protein
MHANEPKKPTSSDALSARAKAIEAAMRRGVRRAIIEHKQRGLPIVIWENNQVTWIPADEIVVPDEPAADAGG